MSRAYVGSMTSLMGERYAEFSEVAIVGVSDLHSNLQPSPLRDGLTPPGRG